MTASSGAPRNPLRLAVTFWYYRGDIRVPSRPPWLQNLFLPPLAALGKALRLQALLRPLGQPDRAPSRPQRLIPGRGFLRTISIRPPVKARDRSVPAVLFSREGEAGGQAPDALTFTSWYPRVWTAGPRADSSGPRICRFAGLSCGRGESNSHPCFQGQGPQPCAQVVDRGADGGRYLP
jgi:hypothetical protein